jgi:hypothetical protein
LTTTKRLAVKKFLRRRMRSYLEKKKLLSNQLPKDLP